MQLAQLELWIDPVSRSGPDAMAVDEWLLQTTQVPVLRVYRWLGDWGSLGYFSKLSEAEAAIPGLNWVRRWTGGGVVDHRADWTYSLAIPASEPLARARGLVSYQHIHLILANVIGAEGLVVQLSEGTGKSGAAACFSNPVDFDLVGEAGVKLAGAGQRRSRAGLLHQGSIAVGCGDLRHSLARAQAIAEQLSAMAPLPFSKAVDDQAISEIARSRYAVNSWTERCR